MAIKNPWHGKLDKLQVKMKYDRIYKKISDNVRSAINFVVISSFQGLLRWVLKLKILLKFGFLKIIFPFGILAI